MSSFDILEDLLTRLLEDFIESRNEGRLPRAGNILAEQNEEPMDQGWIERKGFVMRAHSFNTFRNVGNDFTKMQIEAKLFAAASQCCIRNWKNCWR